MIGTFIQLNEASKYAHAYPIGYVICENGCWEWVGGRAEGYGRLWMNGKVVSAHKYLYEKKYGSVPEGMDLDHFRCDNRGCCNYDHVRPASRRENLLRGDTVNSRNRSKTHCPQGHELAGENLTPGRLLHGVRRCRTCHNAQQNARYRRRQARQHLLSSTPLSETT